MALPLTVPRLALANADTGIKPRSLLRIAGALGFDGVDVARRRGSLPPGDFASIIADSVALAGPTFWIRSVTEAPAGGPGMTGAGEAERSRFVVRLSEDPAAMAADGLAIRSLIATRSAEVPGPRLTIAIPASVRRRGRTHLHRIRRVRAIAEEWDFDVALDLVGADDREWEAEAAVVLLASKLRYVRVRLPPARRAGHTESDLAARTLRALSDTGFDGTVALAPLLPAWRRWNEAEFAERAFGARLDVIDILSGRPSQSRPARYEEESNRM